MLWFSPVSGHNLSHNLLFTVHREAENDSWRMEGDVELELTFDSTNSNLHEEETMKAFTARQGRPRE